MGIETTVKCDYSGYCYHRETSVDEVKKNKWWQIFVNGNTLTIEPFDGNKPEAKVACPLHAEEVAAATVGDMDMFKPDVAAEVPNA